MQTKDIVALIGFAILLAFLALVFNRSPSRRPPERYFRCGRCNTMTPHSDRTVKAWRADKTRFFCSKCHGNWLKSQHPRPEEAKASGYQGRRGNRGEASAGGPLGAIILLLIIIALVVRAYAG